MATAVQKITLSSSRDIPFNKLVLSQSNVRRVKAGVSVEELAESIVRRGLIQSLHVRPVVDAEGNLSEAKHHPRFHSRTLVRPPLRQSTHEGSAYASVPPSRIRGTCPNARG